MVSYEEPGDFRNPEGMLVCGYCGKPKETEPYANGVRFPIVHDHQLQALVRHEETAEELSERIGRNRARCFAGEFAEEGIRDTFDSAALDTDQAALQECQSFVKRFSQERMAKTGAGLILFGQVGRGKTFLAGCVCNALLDEGWRCLMTSTRRIRSEIDRTYGSQNDVLDRLCRNDLVVLDDLFRDKDTEAGREVLFTVVDALYKMRVPVIVTTNLSKDSLTFPNEGDAAVVERLKERCRRVEVAGPNRRQVRML